jgi:hypothetical protein
LDLSRQIEGRRPGFGPGEALENLGCNVYCLQNNGNGLRVQYNLRLIRGTNGPTMAISVRYGRLRYNGLRSKLS